MSKSLNTPTVTTVDAGEQQNRWSDARLAAVVEAAYVLDAVRR
jgi:hypothetical protein